MFTCRVLLEEGGEKRALNLPLLQNKELYSCFPTDTGSRVSSTPPCLPSGWPAKQTHNPADNRVGVVTKDPSVLAFRDVLNKHDSSHMGSRGTLASGESVIIHLIPTGLNKDSKVLKPRIKQTGYRVLGNKCENRTYFSLSQAKTQRTWATVCSVPRDPKHWRGDTVFKGGSPKGLTTP